MAAPTAELERLVLSKLIAHGGNPVMTWMIACTDVKSDRQDNIMPMKPERQKSGKRIDGVVAAIMALDRAMRHEDAVSVYEQRGAVVI
jgi:phage terminase large subunit-like protein